VLTQCNTTVQAHEYARVVLQRVRELLIHHPRATASGRYVTLSAGSCTLVPTHELTLPVFIEACMTAMQRAKGQGKNTSCAAEASDFAHAAGAGAGAAAAAAGS
jgi:PleD family two-component response regulator